MDRDEKIAVIMLIVFIVVIAAFVWWLMQILGFGG